MDNWEGCVQWRSEMHCQMCLATDASGFRYGVSILSGDMKGTSFGDYWQKGDNRPIHLKEAEALLRAVQSLGEKVHNHRLDILTDNKAVLFSWQNQGGRDKHLTDIMKELFEYVFVYNIDINLSYVPSAQNIADTPSRFIDMQDTTLNREPWVQLESLYGPHSVDLMACDSNAMRDGNNRPLKHFTRYPSPLSAGVNVFAQDITKENNPYIFPPFALIFPILNFLKEQRVRVCTFIAPKFDCVPIWEPFLRSHVRSCVCIGEKGAKHVICFPSKNGYYPDGKGLKWDLYAYRLSFS